MASVPKSLYQPNPDRWHWELRNWFLYYLVREHRYKDVTASLGPAWRRVLKHRPDLDPETPYHALPVWRGPGPHDPQDPLNQYILLVRVGAADELRCRERGAPSLWVCHAVHAGVTGASLDIGAAPLDWLWLGELQIPVLSVGTASVVRKINGHPFSARETVERDTIETAHPGTPFNQWKKLKKLAHQELDQLLEELRGQVEGKTDDWQRMNRKGREARTQVTMQKLVRWVVGREHQYFGDRTATYDLLHELRLDTPGQSETSDHKP